MKRRHFLLGAASAAGLLAFSAPFAGRLDAAPAQAAGLFPASPIGGDRVSTFADLVGLATSRASEPAYRPEAISERLASLTYDQYRSIRFQMEKGLWWDKGRGFSVDFFHPGFLFKTPVHVYEITDNRSKPLLFSEDQFSYDKDVGFTPADDTNAFAGFRVRTALNKPSVMDEFLVFLGASYFRAIGQDQNYGLSARGLALKTGEPEPEEFPQFTHFWLVRPEKDAEALEIWALLESDGCTGAYRFRTVPGENTTMDVEAHILPRAPLTSVGLAPLTSMFWFDGAHRQDIYDVRPAVHDSDGLLIEEASGERLWRPLRNPKDLSNSFFAFDTPPAFGLSQRKRGFEAYQDDEARYGRRPSLWVEPKHEGTGHWGAGHVRLLEIPTKDETFDNIVALWQPQEALQPGTDYVFEYRLTWGHEPTAKKPHAQVVRTARGLNFHQNAELIQVDFAEPAGAGEALASETLPEIDLKSGSGTIQNISTRMLPDGRTLRVGFEFLPPPSGRDDLSLALVKDGAVISEKWMYRWEA